MALWAVVEGEVRSHTLGTVLSAVVTVLTGIALAVWAAIEGWSGPAIALSGLGAAASVAVIAFALAWARHQGFLNSRWLRVSLGLGGAAVFLAGANWFVATLGEVRTLRAQVAQYANTVPENPSHAEDLAALRGENVRVGNELADAKIQLSEARSQLTTMTTALSASQSQVADLQQQLSRAQRPNTVVVQSESAAEAFVGWGRTNVPIERDESERTMRLTFGLKNYTNSRVNAAISVQVMVGNAIVGRFNRSLNFGATQELQVTFSARFTDDESEQTFWSQTMPGLLTVEVTPSAPAAPAYTLRALIEPDSKALDIVE